MTGRDPVAHAAEIVRALECSARSSCSCHLAARKGVGKVHCPAHQDLEPSFNVSLKAERVLVRCHTGCEQRDVIAALRERGVWGQAQADPPRRDEGGRRKTRLYRFELPDERGALVAVHCRQEFSDGSKHLWWERPDGRKGLGGREVSDLPLYGLGALEGRTGELVLLTEGEKKRDALMRDGFLAVATTSGAAGTPLLKHLVPLHGHEVLVWPDNDQAGRDHMDRIAARLAELGVAVRVVDWPDAPPKGDAADFLAAGRTREDVLALLAEARPWEPRPDAIHSAALRDGVAAERILAFRTAREIGDSTPEEPEAIVPGYVYRGAITELDGKIKSAGKTTLASHMVRAVLTGELFLGEQTKRTGVVFLTEQSPASFRENLRRTELLGREDLVVLFWHEARAIAWPDAVAAAVAKCAEVGAELLIVDTLPQFAGLAGDGENSAGEALKAMRPLQEAAAVHNLAIVITRHERKSGGDVGDSGRGSSAFAGAVDVIVSVRRGEGNSRPTIRVLSALSRFGDTPETLSIDLVDGRYEVLGDKAAVAIGQAREALAAALPGSEDGAQCLTHLLDRVEGVKRTIAQRALDQLAAEGAIRRDGEGKKGNPYRYWRADMGAEMLSAATTGVVAESRGAAPPIHAPAPLGTNGARATDRCRHCSKWIPGYLQPHGYCADCTSGGYDLTAEVL